MGEESIEVFVEKFFNMVGAKIEKNSNTLIITSIPKDILDFFAKKEPFILTFSNSSNINNNAELVTQGSFFLKMINDYLNKKGQTSILKIDFSQKLNENVTIPIVLKEGALFKQEKKELKDYIVRFSFMSNFQYLNERESVVNDVFVKDCKIFDIDVSNYPLIEGNSKDFPLRDVKGDYTIAKDKVKTILDKKIDQLSKNLDIRLSKEIERLNHHYVQKQKEIDDSLSRLKKNLAEATKDKDDKKIDRLNEEISQLNLKSKSSTSEVEKNFFLQDEKNKHALSVSTKLINTSIIYFPTYMYSLYLKNTNLVRSIDIHFNPFTNSLSDLYCDSCKKVLKQIYLCACGHVVCSSCTTTRCGECSNVLCKLCNSKKCGFCSKSLCRKCEKSCSSCNKKICSSHNRTETGTGKLLCPECSKSCSKCGKWFNKNRLRSTGISYLCESCFRLSVLSRK